MNEMIRRRFMAASQAKPYDSRVEWVMPTVNSVAVYWQTDLGFDASGASWRLYATIQTGSWAMSYSGFTILRSTAGTVRSFFRAWGNNAFINLGGTEIGANLGGKYAKTQVTLLNNRILTPYNSNAGNSVTGINFRNIRIAGEWAVNRNDATKIYRIRHVDGALVFDLYPVRKDGDIYFYNAVGGKMYGCNMNRNYYSYGPDVAEDYM